MPIFSYKNNNNHTSEGLAYLFLHRLLQKQRSATERSCRSFSAGNTDHDHDQVNLFLQQTAIIQEKIMPICPYKIHDENETITLQNTLQITFLMPWTSRTEATRAAIPPTSTAKHFKSCNKTMISKSKWMHSLTGDKKQDIIVLDRLEKDDFEDV